MRAHRTNEWTWASALLIAAGVASLLLDRPAVAGEPASLRDGVWTWGYVIQGPLPGKVPFISDSGRPPFDGSSSCSLEAAAKYLGTPNVLVLNDNWSQPGFLDCLAGCKRVLLAIGDRSAGAAAQASRLSKQYPNIAGVIIDDFLQAKPLVTVEQLKGVYTSLKSQNPALKLYVVRYTRENQQDIVPYLPYIDVINLWVWAAKTEEWTKMDAQVEAITKLTQKPIIIGLYLHDYGGTGKPVAMDILQTQLVKSAELLRKGKTEGFIILQSGWLDHETHRPQVQWTKQYLDWLYQTQTVRK